MSCLGRPAPRVRAAKKLGDFAVTYELNVYCTDIQAMLPMYAALHRNILDVFNEYGVQIMTPAYEGDPAAAESRAAQGLVHGARGRHRRAVHLRPHPRTGGREGLTVSDRAGSAAWMPSLPMLSKLLIALVLMALSVAIHASGVAGALAWSRRQAILPGSGAGRGCSFSSPGG